MVWGRRQEGPRPRRARARRDTIRFSRTGRKDDAAEARLQVVEPVPLDATTDPLVLVTTLLVDPLVASRGSARGFAWRRSVETTCATRKARGRFLVRAWRAIDRLLWAVAVASALLVLTWRAPPRALRRDQATALRKRLAAPGRWLTVGKLAEAIGLDHAATAAPGPPVWLP